MFFNKQFRRNKISAFIILLLVSVLFSSCFNNIERPKNTTVTFVIDSAAVQNILYNGKNSSTKSSRAADDDINADNVNSEANSNEDNQEENFPANDSLLPYKGFYIDVTLFAEQAQTISEKISSEIRLEFKDVAIGSSVYATAQIYEITDSETKEKNIIFRGKSDPILVREKGNVLSIKLANATVTVSFDTNGGSEVEPQTIRSGQIAQEPQAPVKPADKQKYSRDNYVFDGWYKNAELTQPYNFSQPVKDDVILYAKWIEAFVLVPGDTVQNCLAQGRTIKIQDLIVSDHEVTQAEYYAVMGTNPSNNTSDAPENLPVENVSWFDAISYCNKLSIQEGLDPCYKIKESVNPDEWGRLSNDTVVTYIPKNGYRLPTEAEWDYIAQKGKRTNVELKSIAYYSFNGDDRTHRIKYKLADELSLCDVIGNVSEWCYDWYASNVTKMHASGPSTGTARVVRGGSYKTQGDLDTILNLRTSFAPNVKDNAIGFRVVRSLEESAQEQYVHSITYNIDDYDSELEPVKFYESDTITLPANLEKQGYLFSGWYTKSSFDTASKITGWKPDQMFDDVVLYGKWIPITYKIQFFAGDGSGTMQEQTFIYDEEQSLNENAFTAPAGYKFAGWTESVDDENISYTNSQVIKNLTDINGTVIKLYALWIDKSAHIITYNNIKINNVIIEGIDNKNNPQTFKESEQIVISAPNGERLGYEWGGWYDNETFTGTKVTGWSIGSKTEDVVLWAKWIINSYSIEYNLNGGEWISDFTAKDSYTIEENVTLPDHTKLTLSGFDLDGWYTTEDFVEGTQISGWDATAQKTENLVLYAKWIPSSETAYKVEHYQQNSDDAIDAEEKTYTLKETETDKRGTTGNLTQAVAKEYTGFNQPTVTQETIKADGSTVVKLYYDRKQIQYTFEPEGGNWSGDTNSVVIKGLYGAAVDKPENPDKQGYIFSEWDSSVPEEFGAESKIFSAVWEVSTGTPYKVEHYQQNLDDEEQYTLKDTTNKQGTTGQSTAAEEKTYDGFTCKPFQQSTIVADGSTVVKLYYDRNTITYTFKANQGSWAENEEEKVFSAKFGTAFDATEVPDPTKAGYDFSGWDSAIPETFGPENVTFIAGWGIITYDITYYSEGLDITDSAECSSFTKSYTIQSPEISLTSFTLTKAGAIFLGWYADADFSGSVITSIPSGNTGARPLYAKWIYQKTISVTIQSGSWSSESGDDSLISLSYDGSALTEGQTITSSGSITLTATPLDGYTYTWKVDGNTTDSGGNAYSSDNTLTLTTTSWKKGVYDIVVTATDGTHYESCFVQIKVGY